MEASDLRSCPDVLEQYLGVVHLRSVFSPALLQQKKHNLDFLGLQTSLYFHFPVSLDCLHSCSRKTPSVFPDFLLEATRSVSVS